MLKELGESARKNPIWFGAIGVLTTVQGWLGWEFWGSITDEPGEQAALRAIGMSLVGGEVVALDMASRAGVNGEHVRANTLRAMWLSLAVINLAVDMNALAGILAHNEEARIAQTGQGREREVAIQALQTRIDEADDPYGDNLLSVAAYEAQIAAKADALAATPDSHATIRRRLIVERGELEGARAAAAQVEQWRKDLEALEKQTAGAAPVVEAEEFAPLADALTASAHKLGLMKPDTAIAPIAARDGVAIGASLVMKLMLTLGIWAGISRTPQERPKAAANQSRAFQVRSSRDPYTLEGEAVKMLPPPKRPKPQAKGPQRAKRFTRNGRS